MPNIVTVTVSQTSAPIPSTLQGTGAYVSQGATTTAVDVYTPLTQVSDLTPILKGALALSSLTWSANVATATTAAPHGFTTGDTLQLTMAGTTPAGYSVTALCTITGASTYTYPLLTNPGGSPASVPGVYTPEDVAELVAMVTTHFSQDSPIATWVLELGPGNAADGTAALSTYITNNPNVNYKPGSSGFFYIYVVPRAWASEPTFVTMVKNYAATSSRTYFFVTTTGSNYTSFTPLMKSVVQLVEAPGIPSTEFSIASASSEALGYAPSSTNRVTPFAFSFLFGVTPYPTSGNSALLATYKTANVNLVLPTSEGGLTNTALFWGVTSDGRDFTYWYSVDYAQINSDIAVANAIINGSNNPQAPLYYDQDGINLLQTVVAKLMRNMVSYGLAVGNVVLTNLSGAAFGAAANAGTYAGQIAVNAEPFKLNASENPSDYKAGIYRGLSVCYTPARGFTSIIFNVNVTDFVAA